MDLELVEQADRLRNKLAYFLHLILRLADVFVRLADVVRDLVGLTLVFWKPVNDAHHLALHGLGLQLSVFRLLRSIPCLLSVAS